MPKRFQSRIVLVSLLVLAFPVACQKYTKWQYKVVPVSSDSVSRTGLSAMLQTTVDVNVDSLSSWGTRGWELVATYLEVETAFPNFGNEEYHTGIKTNTRPQRLVMIFKRAAGKQ
jgi:hypothetical protein